MTSLPAEQLLRNKPIPIRLNYFPNRI